MSQLDPVGRLGHWTATHFRAVFARARAVHIRENHVPPPAGCADRVGLAPQLLDVALPFAIKATNTDTTSQED